VNHGASVRLQVRRWVLTGNSARPCTSPGLRSSDLASDSPTTRIHYHSLPISTLAVAVLSADTSVQTVLKPRYGLIRLGAAGGGGEPLRVVGMAFNRVVMTQRRDRTTFSMTSPTLHLFHPIPLMNLTAPSWPTWQTSRTVSGGGMRDTQPFRVSCVWPAITFRFLLRPLMLSGSSVKAVSSCPMSAVDSLYKITNHARSDVYRSLEFSWVG